MSGKRPFVLGLTGSIGMGKSTTAGFFREEGIPVWDADAAVHRLYAPGGAAVGPLSALHAPAVQKDAVDRAALRDWIGRDPSALGQIEKLVHPLVAADRAAFLRDAETDIVVLDIPLLFETGADAAMDAVVVVSVLPEIQRARVMARGTMSEAQFAAILARQLPDAEKRARADYVIETLSLEDARVSVQAIVADIRKKLADA